MTDRSRRVVRNILRLRKLERSVECAVYGIDGSGTGLLMPVAVAIVLVWILT